MAANGACWIGARRHGYLLYLRICNAQIFGCSNLGMGDGGYSLLVGVQCWSMCIWGSGRF